MLRERKIPPGIERGGLWKKKRSDFHPVDLNLKDGTTETKDQRQLSSATPTRNMAGI
jgi:hypothetical protein